MLEFYFRNLRLRLEIARQIKKNVIFEDFWYVALQSITEGFCICKFALKTVVHFTGDNNKKEN